MICMEISSIQAKSNISSCRIFDHENKTSRKNTLFGIDLDRCHDLEEIIYTFKLHSLRIKYKPGIKMQVI